MLLFLCRIGALLMSNYYLIRSELILHRNVLSSTTMSVSEIINVALR
jgi:hypothetical protein